MIEPVPGEAVAVAECGPERALVVADYHAGLEVGLRREGVEIHSHADERRQRLLGILADRDVDRVVFVGDLGDAIGDRSEAEREELTALVGSVVEYAPVTVTKGNHDGNIEAVLGECSGVEVVDGPGVRIGAVGFCHGHTWPTAEVLAADVLCTAHEHPTVQLEDAVGGRRTERVWLRGRLDPEGFPEYETPTGRLVVCPAFNGLVGGTWINETEEFLSPFLPAGIADGEAYLLDGTRLGDYRRV